MVGIEVAERDSDKLLVSDCPNPVHIAKQTAHQTLAAVLISFFISRLLTSPLMLNILVRSNGQKRKFGARCGFRASAAFFLHLRGGLTTYSLVVISLTLLIRTRPVTDGA